MLLLFVAGISAASAAVVATAARAQIEVHMCHDKVQFGVPNTLAPLDVDATPAARKLMARVANGKLYRVEVPQPNGTTAAFSEVHVWGSAYEMGYAQGKLLGARLVDFQSAVWKYLEGQVVHGEPEWVPSWLRELVADVGLDVALDLTELATRRFSGDHFYDEMRGMADGAGGDYQLAVRIHMLAGLTQGHCSSFGAWGSATHDGRVLSMRALDWDMDGPFRQHAQVTVYHGSAARGTLSFASVGFTGFVGGLTGLNEKGVSITEIGVSYPDASWGVQSRIGVPFIFVLRDILQFDATRAAGLARMRDAMRTCDLILGVADREAYNAVQYSFSNFYVIGSTNLRPVNATWHFPIVDTVYHGMDWLCPAYNYVLGTQLKKNHGTLTAASVVRDVAGVTRSGDVHIAVYDNEAVDLYVSFAAPDKGTPTDRAYERRFTKYHGASLFGEQQQLLQ